MKENEINTKQELDAAISLRSDEKLKNLLKKAEGPPRYMDLLIVIPIFCLYHFAKDAESPMNAMNAMDVGLVFICFALFFMAKAGINENKIKALTELIGDKKLLRKHLDS